MAPKSQCGVPMECINKEALMIMDWGRDGLIRREEIQQVVENRSLRRESIDQSEGLE